MTTVIIGVGQLGSTIARLLVESREPVVLAARDDAYAVFCGNRRRVIWGLQSSPSFANILASWFIPTHHGGQS
jgi:Trk K+ transport system NAD-binding subunit